MRPILAAAFLASALATPALAQQISPLTGTTEATPPVAAPAAPARPGPGSASRAARPQRHTFRDRFTAANTTNDGRLTLDQAKAANLRAVVRNYDAMDAAHKGYVTMDDVRAYRRSQRQARAASRAQ